MSRRIYDNPNNCPVTKAVEFIGGKWKPIILFLLMDGPIRFGKLTLFLPSISRKILAQQLKELEEDGLIIRHSFSEKPPRVEYELSPKGATAIPILKAMCAWGQQVVEEKLLLSSMC
jgi:DNA-binding HxlR family transcriptional regulator